MSRKSRFLGKGGVLLAAFLITALPTLAGERVRSSSHRVVPPTQPAVVPVARLTAPVTIQVIVTTTAPTADAAVIKLRGPDGQVRRFPVEGGAEGLASRIVILRPGESISIRLATK